MRKVILKTLVCQVAAPLKSGEDILLVVTKNIGYRNTSSHLKSFLLLSLWLLHVAVLSCAPAPSPRGCTANCLVNLNQSWEL